jgi:hypothetical protein
MEAKRKDISAYLREEVGEEPQAAAHGHPADPRNDGAHDDDGQYGREQRHGGVHHTQADGVGRQGKQAGGNHHHYNERREDIEPGRGLPLVLPGVEKLLLETLRKKYSPFTLSSRKFPSLPSRDSETHEKTCRTWQRGASYKVPIIKKHAQHPCPLEQ